MKNWEIYYVTIISERKNIFHKNKLCTRTFTASGVFFLRIVECGAMCNKK